MRITKEAHFDHCKVTCAPDYLSFETSNSSEGIVFNRKEAEELVEWLSHELGRVLPEIMYIAPNSDKAINTTEELKVAKAYTGPVYDPGPRSATQTVELKVGDPNLTYHALGRSGKVSGDGDTAIVDLGALAVKGAMF